MGSNKITKGEKNDHGRHHINADKWRNTGFN